MAGKGVYSAGTVAAILFRDWVVESFVVGSRFVEYLVARCGLLSGEVRARPCGVVVNWDRWVRCSADP